MDPRATNFIFGLIAIGALAAAAFLYVSQTPTPQVSPEPISTLTPSPETTLDASPTVEPSASPSPSTSNRTFSQSQALSLPNLVETISLGGSLFSIAQSHGISVSELAKLNGISDPDRVIAGQTIIVPDDISDGTYTLLYVLNPNRLAREQQQLAEGSTSLYSDPITAAQTDTKGIYGLASDTPYSRSNETATAVTLSSTDAEKITTITMEKHTSGMWHVKKLVIKTVAQEGA